MSGQQLNKLRTPLLMFLGIGASLMALSFFVWRRRKRNKDTKENVEDVDEARQETVRKKSVDNGLNGTLEDLGANTSSPSTSNILGTTSTPTRKPPSPSGSPRHSPKLEGRQESHHVKSLSQSSLLINAEKSDNIENTISKSSDSSSQQISSSDCGKSQQIEAEKPKSTSKVSERAKKKAWYSVLYPSYKSRSEDFKKLFKDVPDDERLVVDYSCALQREILVHGRLYVSQNFLCFYANIFRWETCLSVKWTDVECITKEKTARVIPNAILVTTKNDKHFLTSFTSRDKTFLMLFRVWQNALMDKQMKPQEMWQWVHNCYGDELGLTSDDEDYIDPYLNKVDEESVNSLALTKNKSAESCAEDQNFTDNKSHSAGKAIDGTEMNTLSISNMDAKMKPLEAKRKMRLADDNLMKSSELLSTDISDSSDSEGSKNIPFISTAECTSMHEGRQLVHTILPINVDNLFNLLFSKSKFLVDFHTSRKSTDMIDGDWDLNEDGLKTRSVSITVALSHHLAPKAAHVTETQVIRDCSQPGQLYSIDIHSANAGIPYADSFNVFMHYCLVRTVDDHTMLSVHAQIKYKKSIWGVVKGFIEKNTWAGLEDFYTALLRALQSEYCIPPAKGKGRRPRRDKIKGISTQPRQLEEAAVIPVQPDAVQNKLPSPNKVFAEPRNKYKAISCSVIALLSALILLNVILLFKLWNLETKDLDNSEIGDFPNFSALHDLPKNHEDWIELLKQQEALHETEMRKYQTVLQTAIELLKKTESTLNDLLLIIQVQRTSTEKSIPAYMSD